MEEINIEDYKSILRSFATITQQQIRDLTKNTSSGSTVSFSTYDKDTLLSYMKSPETNEKNLRNASIQMYNNSIHYRNFILFYALMCPFYYTIEPVAYDSTKAKPETIRKAYLNACKYIEPFNLKHELQVPAICTFRDGVYYGAIWKQGSFIQRIDPDICKISAKEAGTYLYAVDMSQIKEDNLSSYPPEFSAMHDAYEATGIKYQQVPSDITFCLKADETCTYPTVPFVSLLPSIYDLENQKELAEVSETLDNYKLVNYIYPTDEDGKPTQEASFNEEIYQHIANALPPAVGLAMTGKELKALTFDRSNNGSQADAVEQSISNFWLNTGVPVAIEGSPDLTASGAILLSLRPEERKSIALLNQIERVLNRLLSYQSGSQKCRINMLPITCFNYSDYVKQIKEATTLGIPVKSDLAIAMNVPATDIQGKAFLENDILGLNDIFIPLSSTYTGDAGRPKADTEELTDEGERARDKASGDTNPGEL